MPLKEVNWDSFEFRCHYLGELMTQVRGESNEQKYEKALASYNKKFDAVSKMKPGDAMEKALDILQRCSEKVDYLKTIKDLPNLSDTCKKRLANIYTTETTGRIKDIESMYIEKGLRTEEDSITKYSLVTGKMYRKNSERISNGFLSGEIDFDDDLEDMVIDTKSSFDIFTFDATVARGINPIYEWQGHAYMWLKNRKRFRLAYCLNNTPEDIIKRLEQKMKYNFVGSQSDFEDACALLKDKHTYNDLPDSRRIRIYDLNRDDDKISQIMQMVPIWRNYLNNIPNVANIIDYAENNENA